MENIVRKGEIVCNKQFLLFSQFFLPYMALIFHFKCTVKCRLQFVSVLTSLKFCHLVMDLAQRNIKWTDFLLCKLDTITGSLPMFCITSAALTLE